ncbi:FAD-binding oxidoreductase [Symbioplanes lichenis]|uniref:FAD-binding oxidoreductase n=1 Tax=Symbioplanes lichenis TaxID=1629072 RepID=UPI0027391A85|nr:FAD-binding oxidoreductase [Actinoplanes lichenis]
MEWAPATEADHIDGVPARWVAAPTTTAEAAAVLERAARDNLAVGIRGGGTKLDWGLPPRRLDLLVDTKRLSGVLEHAAGDLIAIVRAGTRLDTLDFGSQHLALDPLPGATVGGTVALNTSGPRRLLHGTARDLLIGITVVRPDGRVTRSGGKVVKNVAGYDLGKLYTGSYGTLGLITECVFRLHPVAGARAVVTTPVPRADLGALLATIRAEQVVPSAVELDRPDDGPVTVAVLVEGTPAGVHDRAAQLEKATGGTTSADPPPWWGRYPWQPGETGVKLTAPLSRVPALAEPGVRGSAGTGVLYARLTGDIPARLDRIRAAAIAAGGHAVVLTAPPDVRERVDMWGPVPGLALMRRVKDRFDPGHRFAPGRFAGGI